MLAITERQLELILLIQDSSDGLSAMAELTAQRDDRVQVVKITEVSLAAARNKGIAAATGRYITFLNPGDRLQRRTLKDLLDVAEHDDCDVALGAVESSSCAKRFLLMPADSPRTTAIRRTNIIKSPELQTSTDLRGKIFRTSFLRSLPATFDTSLNPGDEVYFVLQAMRWARSISYLPKVTYRSASFIPSQDASLFVRNGTAIIRKLDADFQEIDTPIIRTLRYQGLLPLLYLQLERLLASHAAQPQCDAALAAIAQVMQSSPPGATENLPVRASLALELIRLGRVSDGSTLMRTHRWKLTRSRLTHVADSLPPSRNNRVAQQTRLAEPLFLSVVRDSVVLQRSFRRLENLARLVSLLIGVVISQLKISIALALSLLVRPAKPLWLIGERKGLGIDNTGDQLCAYLLKHRPEIDVRFVTRIAQTKALPPEVRASTLPYGSLRQLVYLCNAQVVIFTDCFDDVASFWRWGIFSKWLNRRFISVFLGHGVTALNHNFGFYDHATMLRRKERIDLVTVCSEQEKDFWVRGFGHPAEHAQITGSPRLDNLPLHALSGTRSPRSILFAPTSRRPLRQANRRSFLASHYYQEISSFLESPSLRSLLVAQDATLTLVLHHSMARFKPLFRTFESDRISVTDMASESVQPLLISADLLITDYSSVAFDFLYMSRPVIFFQFDRASFESIHGSSFVDSDAALPGPVATTASEVQEQIQLTIGRSWQIDEQSLAKIKNFFQFQDLQNCERITAAINARLVRSQQTSESGASPRLRPEQAEDAA